MDGDRRNYGRGTGGGSDRGQNRQVPPPPAQPQSGKYVPPHLRNRGSDAVDGPHSPSYQRQGLGRSSEMGCRSWDPPPAPPTQRTSGSGLPSSHAMFSLLLFACFPGLYLEEALPGQLGLIVGLCILGLIAMRYVFIHLVYLPRTGMFEKKLSRLKSNARVRG